MNIKFAKAVIYVLALILIINYSTVFLGQVAGFFVLRGKSIDDLIQLLKIHPRYPQLLYFGAISGLITSPIYIITGINLLRLRYWARKLLIWFIPLMFVVDIVYLFLVDMLNKSTSTTLIVDLVIWFILLNRDIAGQFEQGQHSTL